MQSANVDEQQLWSYAKWQIPVYSPEQEEGIFLTLATEYSQRSWMPSLSYMKIDSYFKDQSNVNDLVFYLMKNQRLYSQDYTTKSRNRRSAAIRGFERREFEQQNNENEHLILHFPHLPPSPNVLASKDNEAEQPILISLEQQQSLVCVFQQIFKRKN